VRHEHREVPGGDGGADAVAIVVDGGFDAVAFENFWLDGVGDFLGLPVHAGGAAFDFADAFADGFALLEREEFAEFFGSFFEDFPGGLEDVGAFLRGECLPSGECGVGFGDDAVDLRDRRDRDGSDDFAS